MIDRTHPLSIVRQAKILGISRGTVYLPQPVSPEGLALMRRIDKLHLDYPWAGARMLRDWLGREGHPLLIIGIGQSELRLLDNASREPAALNMRRRTRNAW